MQTDISRYGLRLLWLVGIGVLLWFSVAGSDYYATALIERPRHPGYWTLKPGGAVGHALGVAGSAMMVLLLGYSARKRWAPMRKLGPLSGWLDVHIWLGVVGPLLIVLHTSFKVQGLVALSFWSMIVVAVSGVLGRYLYLQIPRTKRGDEMSLKEVDRREAELTARLRHEVGDSEEMLRRLESLRPSTPTTGCPFAIATSMLDDLRLPFRVRRVLLSSGTPPRLRREIGRTLRQQWRLRRRIALCQATQRVFHYWHVAHKPFAMVMYLFMVIHILVAMVTGYALGGRS